MYSPRATGLPGFRMSEVMVPVVPTVATLNSVRKSPVPPLTTIRSFTR